MSRKLSEILKDLPFSIDRVGKLYVKSINKSKTNEQSNNNNRRKNHSHNLNKEIWD